jgi:hypothetical protein
MSAAEFFPAARASARPYLGAIRAVTYAAPDLSAVEAAYVGILGYQVFSRSYLDSDLASAWGAPVMAGRPCLTLAPASGEAVFLRFIQSPAARGWRALKSFGWNATEFVVQDVDALATRLEGGPFTVIGPPKGLSRFPTIRAMQAIGPFGECCYFTQVDHTVGLSLAPALSFVGRVFIVVAAGPDADALFQPYNAFANATDPPVATPVKIISDAHGLAPDALHRHGLVRLPHGTLVELDAYPETATPRAVIDGELSPGMAMVSFDVEALGAHDFIRPAVHGPAVPGGGAAACLSGAAGELIELIAPLGASSPRIDL